MMALRGRDKEEFLACYRSLCAKQSVCPIDSMRAHKAKITNKQLSLKVDRLQPEDWHPLLAALRCNASLQTIALQSIWFETRRKVTSERDRRRNRGLVAPHLKHPPVVHSPAATYDVASA